MTTTSGPRPSRLNVGDAIHDGWLAFSRSPWAFVGFALLVTLAQLLCQPLQARIGTGNQLSTNPFDWVLYLVGAAASLTPTSGVAVGLVRGAWEALEGGRPSLLSLIRWDGPRLVRTLQALVLVALLVAGPLLAISALVGGPLLLLGWLAERPGWIPLALLQLLALALMVVLVVLVGLVGVISIYLTINQKFLVQIALLEDRGPVAIVMRGRQLIDPHWPLLLLLVVVEALLILLGILACFVGLFVAWPVVVCITTAAYRQLLGCASD